MFLQDIKPIRISESALFFISAFLVVFYFYFTRSAADTSSQKQEQI